MGGCPMTQQSWQNVPGFKGVRFREHQDRKHQRKPDRYFSIRYSRHGKRIEEGAGWATEGMTAQKANALRSTIVENIRLGRHPQSLEEMRAMDRDRIEAAQQEAEAEARLNITFDEVFVRYLDTLKGGHRKSTESRYRTHLAPVFGAKPLRSISPFDLERFKSQAKTRTLSAKSIHHDLCIIRTVFRKAAAWGLYSGGNPCDKVAFPKLNNKRIRYLSIEEAHTLLAALRERSPQTADQALLALHCGLRAGEVLDLRWGNLDFKARVIHLFDPKAGESQQAFMTDQVEEMLLSRLPENVRPADYIFPGRDGGRQFGISCTFVRTVADLGLNDGVDDARERVVFHSLRHTFCSWLALQGTPLYTIQRLARHKSIAMTERYAHLAPDHKQDAVNGMAAMFAEGAGEVKQAAAGGKRARR